MNLFGKSESCHEPFIAKEAIIANLKSRVQIEYVYSRLFSMTNVKMKIQSEDVPSGWSLWDKMATIRPGWTKY